VAWWGRFPRGDLAATRAHGAPSRGRAPGTDVAAGSLGWRAPLQGALFAPVSGVAAGSAMREGEVMVPMPRRRHSVLGAIAAGLGLLAMTACGGSAAPASSTSSAQETASSTASAAQSGVIVDGLFEEPNHINPILGPGMTFAEIVETSMFRNLFNVDTKGNLLPDLASVVPTQANGGISKDGLTYTIQLNPNANWTNGQPVTCQDLITTWQLDINPKVVALNTTGWTSIKSITAVSPKECKVVLKGPTPALLQDAFSNSGTPGILPDSVFHKYLSDPAGVAKAKFNHDPTVSDGPFMFKSWAPGASITVVANPKWYGPKPKAQEIVYKIIPSQATLLTAAQAHSINVYYFAPITQLAQLQAISGAKVFFTAGPAWENAAVNLKNPVLAHLRVREALEMAINRPELVSKVWQGHAVLLGADQPPGTPGASPNVKPWPYDPAKAKQLLQQVLPGMGYTLTNGLWEKGGQPLTFIYSTTAGNTWREASEQLDQFWLKQIGITLQIKNYPANAYFGHVLPSKTGWDLAEYEDSEGLDPVATFVTDRECNSPSNFASICNKQVDSLVNQAANSATFAQAMGYIQQAEVIMNQQLYHLWYYDPAGIEVAINMTGYNPNPYVVDTWDVYDWAPSGS
jgi:peptide/nickel transport system substrate-binding protein